MNFDFARAVTQGSGGNGPDPRVVSNKGFDSFSVPAGGTIGATTFSNGNVDASGALDESTAGGTVTWTAPDGGTLDWGTLYSYSITTTAAPVAGRSRCMSHKPARRRRTTSPRCVPSASVPDDTVFANGSNPFRDRHRVRPCARRLRCGLSRGWLHSLANQPFVIPLISE